MSQHDTPAHSGRAITLLKVRPYEARGIAIDSNAVGPDGRIDPVFSADQDNISPQLSWSAVLEAECYALVVEDPDAPQDDPFIHWLIWNIDGRATELPPGVSKTPHPAEAPGAVQGLNSGGEPGWYGPKPPPGHGVHHYHFQLFALDQKMPDSLKPHTPLAELVNLLKAHTIADGELVGTFETPETLQV